jgi:hypothetical protein
LAEAPRSCEPPWHGSVPNVKRAHALLEAGHVIGKLVLEGF